MQREGPAERGAPPVVFSAKPPRPGSIPGPRLLSSRAMLRATVLAALASALIACGGFGTNRPASDGVRSLVSALRNDNPRDAYDLMSSDARKKIGYDEFALQWKQMAAERMWQARVLEESLKGDPDVGERALVGFGDGKQVQLEREGKAWRLDSALVSRSRAGRSRDAVKLFQEAIAHRDINAILGVLTARRREGLQKQIDGFLTGLEKHQNDRIEESGSDRAELRWDESGIRYKIILRKEEGEWRVDDIVIRATTDEGEEGEGGDVEGADREID
jgi:hypothetical protein